MMALPPFRLEEYFAKWEFSASHLFCMSDAECFSMREIIDLMDSEVKDLWNDLSLGYTETKGHPVLRKEIAKLYENTIDESHILTTAGGEEGIYCGLRALLAPSDHVIVITPCYQSLKALPLSICEVSECVLDPKKNWNLDLDELKQKIQTNTKAIIINFPHSPTGALLSKEAFNQLIALAREKSLYIFSDEVYRYMEIDPNDRLPAIAESYEKGISVFVMTKPFGLGGLRIGWIASQDKDFLENAAAYKHYTSICNSAPSEILALSALRSMGKLLQRNVQIMLDNLELLDAFFEQHAKMLSWVRPKAGCIGFVAMKDIPSIDTFAKELVEKESVLILPAKIYDYPGNYFRIGFGRKNMPECLKKFERFLKSYG